MASISDDLVLVGVIPTPCIRQTGTAMREVFAGGHVVESISAAGTAQQSISVVGRALQSINITATWRLCDKG